MAEYELECQGCGVTFTAKSPRAKWHAPGCKKRKQREAATDPESPVDAAGDGADHEPTANSTYGRDVLDAVRRDLEKADVLQSVDGRVAMYLARQAVNPDAKNPAALLKEMRAALTTALAGSVVENPPAPEPTPDDDDEVTRARKSREEARKAAGLS